MSELYKDTAQDRAELLRDTARSLFPIVEGDIMPATEVPPLSLEMLGLELQDYPGNRFRTIGRLVSVEGTFAVDYTTEQQLSLALDDNKTQVTYSIKQHASDLPQSLIDGSDDVFVGPLILGGEYEPNGFAVWRLLPETGGK